MSFLSRMRRQKATLWVLSGTDDHGEPTYDAPVELRVRWSYSVKNNIAPEHDRESRPSSYFLGQDVKPGDVLMPAPVSTVVSGLAPKEHPLAGEVVTFKKTPTLRATQFVRHATL